MLIQKRELTQEQHSQIVKWKDVIATYEAKGEECFSSAMVQALLTEIQDFIKYGLPDHLFTGIKKVTDAIFEASLVLAEPDKNQDHYRQASRLLYLAIKELCSE